MWINSLQGLSAHFSVCGRMVIMTMIPPINPFTKILSWNFKLKLDKVKWDFSDHWNRKLWLSDFGNLLLRLWMWRQRSVQKRRYSSYKFSNKQFKIMKGVNVKNSQWVFRVYGYLPNIFIFYTGYFSPNFQGD